MLVLTRKKNEDIIIGEGNNRVIIRVVEIVGDKVRLGFTAQPTVQIFRKEIAPKDKEETGVDGLERQTSGGPFYPFK
jgi:carbon storage regulator CsrA